MIPHLYCTLEADFYSATSLFTSLSSVHCLAYKTPITASLPNAIDCTTGSQYVCKDNISASSCQERTDSYIRWVITFGVGTIMLGLGGAILKMYHYDQCFQSSS
ncbi:hypothetical protein C7212DRAFT_308460 [Tuber magnatum]|uniref:Uncharacterized protein n=1 Tax=Tuber magnatum TaxID=42249 RepID=A0A317T1G5_9PEZI|nr:hypothetical protein C7212DRAFT_308460 [Tuber magnatum]